MMNPLDILQRTPKTNCGKCGYPACLAFSANVARSGEDPKKCPYINLIGLEINQSSAVGLDKLAQEHDLNLIRHLQSKIAEFDFEKIAPSLGVKIDKKNNEKQLKFTYLGQQVVMGKRRLLIDGIEPEDPRDQILLYNYIHSQGGKPPSGQWIGLESLPNSISKIRTLATYCENRLSSFFAGQNRDTILLLTSKIGGQRVENQTATAAVIIPVLPRLPQRLIFWDEEPEEGFEAKVKVLFDENVLDYLDLESLVFSSERMADRLMHMAEN